MTAQDVWITIRLKGTMSTNEDPHRVGELVQAQANTFFSASRFGHSFMVSQPGDVIEVAVEEQIYGS